jgi:hypothetical protein
MRAVRSSLGRCRTVSGATGSLTTGIREPGDPSPRAPARDVLEPFKRCVWSPAVALAVGVARRGIGTDHEV